MFQMAPSNYAKLTKSAGRISDAISEIMGCGLPFGVVKVAFESLSVALKEIDAILPEIEVVAGRDRSKEEPVVDPSFFVDHVVMSEGREDASACTEFIPASMGPPPMRVERELTSEERIKIMGQFSELPKGKITLQENQENARIIERPAELPKTDVSGIEESEGIGIYTSKGTTSKDDIVPIGVPSRVDMLRRMASSVKESVQ